MGRHHTTDPAAQPAALIAGIRQLMTYATPGNETSPPPTATKANSLLHRQLVSEALGFCTAMGSLAEAYRHQDPEQAALLDQLASDVAARVLRAIMPRWRK